MGAQWGRIAIIGDLHSAWNARDVAYFNGSSYELLLFTGDLGASTKQDGTRIAKAISRLERPTLVMPGNNDAPFYSAIAAELAYQQGARALLREGPARKPAVKLCGYSQHAYSIGPNGVTIVAGRPFSMGGPDLTFRDTLARELGVGSLEESVARIVAVAREAPTRDLIFLSHNGPTGLGERADSPWGRDFASPSCDWGDLDLERAIERVRAGGKHRVLAVIAGHMHSPTRGGRPRASQARRDGVLYVNPARVPRIFEHDGKLVHHHVELALTADGVEASERLVPVDDGEVDDG